MTIWPPAQSEDSIPTDTIYFMPADLAKRCQMWEGMGEEERENLLSDLWRARKQIAVIKNVSVESA